MGKMTAKILAASPFLYCRVLPRYLSRFSRPDLTSNLKSYTNNKLLSIGISTLQNSAERRKGMILLETDSVTVPWKAFPDKRI